MRDAHVQVGGTLPLARHSEQAQIARALPETAALVAEDLGLPSDVVAKAYGQPNPRGALRRAVELELRRLASHAALTVDERERGRKLLRHYGGKDKCGARAEAGFRADPGVIGDVLRVSRVSFRVSSTAGVTSTSSRETMLRVPAGQMIVKPNGAARPSRSSYAGWCTGTTVSCVP